MPRKKLQPVKDPNALTTLADILVLNRSAQFRKDLREHRGALIVNGEHLRIRSERNPEGDWVPTRVRHVLPLTLNGWERVLNHIDNVILDAVDTIDNPPTDTQLSQVVVPGQEPDPNAETIAPDSGLLDEPERIYADEKADTAHDASRRTDTRDAFDRVAAPKQTLGQQAVNFMRRQRNQLDAAITRQIAWMEQQIKETRVEPTIVAGQLVYTSKEFTSKPSKVTGKRVVELSWDLSDPTYGAMNEGTYRFLRGLVDHIKAQLSAEAEKVTVTLVEAAPPDKVLPFPSPTTAA